LFLKKVSGFKFQGFRFQRVSGFRLASRIARRFQVSKGFKFQVSKGFRFQGFRFQVGFAHSQEVSGFKGFQVSSFKFQRVSGFKVSGFRLASRIARRFQVSKGFRLASRFAKVIG